MSKQHKWHKEIKAWADGAEIEKIWISDDFDNPHHWHVINILNGMQSILFFALNHNLKSHNICMCI